MFTLLTAVTTAVVSTTPPGSTAATATDPERRVSA